MWLRELTWSTYPSHATFSGARYDAAWDFWSSGILPLSHSYFLRSTGTEATSLPEPIGQSESQIADHDSPCWTSGLTLDHPLSSPDKDPSSPPQPTFQEDGQSKQIAHTSVTSRVMNVESQHPTQSNPDYVGHGAPAVDIPRQVPTPQTSRIPTVLSLWC